MKVYWKPMAAHGSIHPTWNPAQYQELCDIFSSYSDSDFWGFKDPRSLILYRGIRRCMPEMFLAGTFRNPYSVVNSLLTRNPGLATEEELIGLWKTYNDNMLAIWEENKFPIINFDDSDEDYLENFNKLCSIVGCKNISNSSEASMFFEAGSRSHNSSNTISLPEDVLYTYNRLRNICLK